MLGLQRVASSDGAVALSAEFVVRTPGPESNGVPFLHLESLSVLLSFLLLYSSVRHVVFCSGK